MRITDLLKSDSIVLGASPADKAAAINQLADLMEAGGNLSDKEQYKKDVFAREASGTTGLGDGIATPHAKSAGVKAAGLAAMTVPAGMDFESMDGLPSRLFFMIAAPDSANDDHLAILSKLATMIMDPDFKEALIAAKSKDEFLKLIDAKEDGNFVAPAAAAADAVEEAPKADHIQVLAVTACPTGIAHTFMAAESLEQHAKKRGITIKVETNGSGGAKNVLTAEEIAKADAIIVAADKNVAMARFDGKPTIITKVADGINKADELLDRALSGNAPIYHASGSDAEESAADVSGESLGRQIYKHLMNGVSHMLPFVVGGGILIAMAFLFDDYSIDPSKFGSNTPLAKFFMDIGGASFGFMLPILAGFIAMSIADRPGLAVGFVGGAEFEYQATDLLSLSFGTLYSQQGIKNNVDGVDGTVKMDYINMPVLLNFYVVKGLALKTGIQPGFEVNDKVKVTTSGTTVEMGLEKALKAAGVDCSVKSVDFAIPFGLSYEYRNFQVDARYNLSLTKAVEADGESARHSVFQITLGYKFGL